MKSRLLNDINELLDNKVISSEVASNIRGYYNSKAHEPSNKLNIVFGVLGSTLVGLGIILIVAHNWDNFPKTVKTLFAFIPLLIGQFLTGFSIFKKKSNTWRESSATFLFFSVGACIALVSQIYNLPGSLSSFLFLWIILCLPIVYLANSKSVLILLIAYITYYGCEYGYAFGVANTSPWWYIVFLLAIAPYYIHLLISKSNKNIVYITNWAISISLTSVLGAFVVGEWEHTLLMYMMLFGLLFNVGRVPSIRKEPLIGNGFLIMGSLGAIVILSIVSFEWIWDGLSKIEDIKFLEQEVIVSMALLALSLAVMILFKAKSKPFNWFQYVFLLFPVVYFMGFSAPDSATIAVNVIILVLGIYTIKRGADAMHFGMLNYGLVIIAALITCRFFDYNISYVLRGLIFVIIGIGFFLANYFILQKRKGQINNV